MKKRDLLYHFLLRSSLTCLHSSQHFERYSSQTFPSKSRIPITNRFDGMEPYLLSSSGKLSNNSLLGGLIFCTAGFFALVHIDEIELHE